MFDQWATIKVSIAEIREAMSPTNLYYASQALGREATALEAVQHYVQHRDAQPFKHYVVQEPNVSDSDGVGLFV